MLTIPRTIPRSIRRLTRHGLLAAAVIGSLTTTAVAGLKPYITTDPVSANTKPPTNGGAGWVMTAGPIVVQPGQTIWLAFENDGPDTTREKIFKWEMTGNIQDLDFDYPLGVMQAVYNPNTPTSRIYAGFIKYDPIMSGNMTYEHCPVWERMEISNPTNQPIQIDSIWANSACIAAQQHTGGAFSIDQAHFAGPSIMIDTPQYDDFFVFPGQMPLDPNQLPGFIPPPNSNPWLIDPANQDPFGNPRPEGGWHFQAPELPGILPGDGFGFDFQMQGPTDSLYHMFFHDASTDQYEFYIYDTARPPYVELFVPSMYVPGEGLIDVRGWQGFGGNPQADGIISPFPQNPPSPPFSLDVQGGTDLVREFWDVEGGQWTFSTWTYVPGDFQAGGNDTQDGSHLFILDTYDHGAGTGHIGVDLQFGPQDQFRAWDGTGGFVDVPYIVDQWVPIDVVVDLENDWTQIFYDQQLVTEYQWTAGAFGDGQGQPAIAAVDLFGQGSTSVFYDDFALFPMEAFCPFDINEDGEVNVFDMLQVLANWGPCPEGCDTDFNNDGVVNVFDLLEILSNWGPC